jgi:hypothetical protein
MPNEFMQQSKKIFSSTKITSSNEMAADINQEETLKSLSHLSSFGMNRLATSQQAATRGSSKPISREQAMVDFFADGFTRKPDSTNIFAQLNAVRFTEHTEKQFQSLPAKQRDALNFYIGNRSNDSLANTGIYFNDINDYLRFGNFGRPALEAQVEALSLAFKKALSTLPTQSGVTYRAVDSTPIKGLSLLEVGAHFSDKAPMSSSENPGFVRSWFRSRMASQNVDSPAIFLILGKNGINTGNLTNKSEVIYKPDTVFELKHKEARSIDFGCGIVRSVDFFVMSEIENVPTHKMIIDLASGESSASHQK